jgi:hypothetical protein
MMRERMSTYTVTWQQKDRSSGARRDGRCLVAADKYVSLATDKHATIEELLKTTFSMRSALKSYSESYQEKLAR